MIECKDGNIYTGITTDVARRFSEHLSGTKGAKFFRKSPPVKILYTEEHSSRSEASKREYEIKKYSRAKKINLIEMQQEEQ